MRQTLLVFTVALVTVVHATDYAPVDPKPSFKSVTELAFTKSTNIVTYGDAKSQFALGWIDKKINQDIPLLTIIHGGCWLSAFDITHSYPMASALAQAGYPTWSIEYRRTGEPDGGWPNSLDDILNGVDALLSEYTKQNAALPKSLVLIGHSAGGHLALLAAHQLQQNYDIEIRVIGLAAIVDIETYARGDNSCQKAAPQFMTGSPDEKPEAYRKANPKYLLDDLNGWLLHGEQDNIVPISQAKLAKESPLKVINQPGAGHFDWIHPGSPAFSRLLELLSTEESK